MVLSTSNVCSTLSPASWVRLDCRTATRKAVPRRAKAAISAAIAQRLNLRSFNETKTHPHNTRGGMLHCSRKHSTQGVESAERLNCSVDGRKWRTQEDSNLWPLPSEGSALSS